MCGIVGIISKKPVAAEIYESLIHLQHRGQDAAGIMTYNQRLHVKKGMGLVRDIFDEHNMARLLGNVGIGHTRYPTAGGFSREEAQPIWTSVPYGIALAHNGNLVNYEEMIEELVRKRRRFINTNSDTEIILHLFADELGKFAPVKDDTDFFEQICAAVKEVFKHCIGAISAVCIIIGRGMVVFRDPHGIRPFTRGERRNSDGSSDHIFTSETTMYYALGYEYKGNVLPGEVIYVSESGEKNSRIVAQAPFSPCIFEYVYFARPDTWMNDVNVYRARLRMGQNLAKQWKEKHPDVLPDVVIPAPSTADTAALSMSHELGTRYSEGLYKNPFIGRTFIMPGQTLRKKSVKFKLVPQELEIRNKRVMIVDDSIVRGTTSREIVKMIREFGAKAVYFVSACPPVRFPCYYGVDIPTRDELIASKKTEEEIRRYMGVDILMYQRIEDLVEAVTRRGEHHIDRPCMACLDGHYITGSLDEQRMTDLENLRKKHREDNG
jgi:amidophosphoribosyltransferase